MPEAAPLDLALLDNWFGFRPGMTRTQVGERLQQLGVEEDPYNDHHTLAELDGHEVEFFYAEEGSERLRQFSIDGSKARWSGRPLGERLDAALRALEPFGRTPMWQANDATDVAFPPNPPTGPVADEQLLEEGTLWLPDRGLGLAVCCGEVLAVAWREARDLPTQYAGSLTEAQRELSRRPDLEEYLRKNHRESSSAAAAKDPMAVVNTLLILACVGMLALIGRRGFHEMQLWNQAPVLSGKFVSVEKVPRKKFLDIAPDKIRRLMPDDPARTQEIYHIVYLDPAGRRQSAALEAAEFYIPPRESGEEVQIAYVEGDPPQVKGLSRARDAAFLDCFPMAIGVGLFLFADLAFISLVPRFKRLVVRGGAPRAKAADPDRPELR